MKLTNADYVRINKKLEDLTNEIETIKSQHANSKSNTCKDKLHRLIVKKKLLEDDLKEGHNLQN